MNMKRILLLSMVFSFVFVFSSWAQRTVSGKVTDDGGEALPGVNVVIKGTTTGVTTDLDGNYRISVDPGQCAPRLWSGHTRRDACEELISLGNWPALHPAHSGVPCLCVAQFALVYQMSVSNQAPGGPQIWRWTHGCNH